MRAYFGLVLAAVATVAACGDDGSEADFQQVGGEGGDITGVGGGTTKATSGPTTGPGPASSSSQSGSSTASASSSTGSSGCNDLGPGEPNDTEAAAHDFGTIGDCDDEGGMVSGLLDGTGDPDWYKYLGEDASATCMVDPHRTIVSSDPIRICKFFECLDNETSSFTCPAGTTGATSPDGRPGCCSDVDFLVDLICGSSSLDADDAWVYVRIDTTVNACVTYTMSYAY